MGYSWQLSPKCRPQSATLRGMAFGPYFGAAVHLRTDTGLCRRKLRFFADAYFFDFPPARGGRDRGRGIRPTAVSPTSPTCQLPTLGVASSMTTRSSLARFARLGHEPDPAHARRAARLAWQDHGLILINPEWLASWADRKQAELLAEKLHGKRKDQK